MEEMNRVGFLDRLKEQIQLLVNACSEYDRGQCVQAISMAVILRVLLHDTNSSHSLLGQLGLKSNPFCDGSTTDTQNNLLSYEGLLVYSLNNGEWAFEPRLNERAVKSLPFDSWWNDTIFRDGIDNQFSRKDIVQKLANQWGGAHIDPNPNQAFRSLYQENSLGWVVRREQGDVEVKNNPVWAAIRQISFEVILFLEHKLPELFSIENLFGGVQNKVLRFLQMVSSNREKLIVARDASWVSAERRPIWGNVSDRSEMTIVYLDLKSSNKDRELSRTLGLISLLDSRFPKPFPDKSIEVDNQFWRILDRIREVVWESTIRKVILDQDIELDYEDGSFSNVIDNMLRSNEKEPDQKDRVVLDIEVTLAVIYISCNLEVEESQVHDWMEVLKKINQPMYNLGVELSNALQISANDSYKSHANGLRLIVANLGLASSIKIHVDQNQLET